MKLREDINRIKKVMGLKEYFDPLYFIKNKLEKKVEGVKFEANVKYEADFQKYVNVLFKVTQKEFPVKHLKGLKVLKVTPQTEWVVLICPVVEDWFNYQKNEEFMRNYKTFIDKFRENGDMIKSPHGEGEVRYSTWNKC